MSEQLSIPPAEEPTAPPARDLSFFNERLLPLGWSPERNIITLPADVAGDGKEHTYPLFDVDEHGNILINYYSIRGNKAEYRNEGAKWGKHYQVKRLRSPMLDKNGDALKYLIPKGAGTFAWFPPELLAAYREKRQLDMLVLTEGAFKAFAASGHGLPTVGLTSITHYQDKAAGTLHADVIELLRVCRPKEVVWLVDGDCQNLSGKFPEVDPNVDLQRRPHLFYSSAKNIGTLLKDHARTLGFAMWFAHVNSHSMKAADGSHPKGLDDLLLLSTEALGADGPAQVVQDLQDVSKPPRFFERKDLDRPNLLKEYFHLRSAQDFYSHYQEQIGTRPFVYDGTLYQWEEPAGGGQGELKVKVPSVAKNYVRVGCEYFKRIKVPNKFQDLEEKLVGWKRPTIVEDHGKHFCDHIMKLEAFCNVPNHQHYEEIIKSCLNTYGRFEHEADEHADKPEATLRFLAHIFGKGAVKVPHPKKKDDAGNATIMEVAELDLGLDYLQLLYQRPTQMLPILCLVSKERGTGKTTFFKYIKQLLTSNCCFVGGKDFESDFNAHYASKKVIILDEALIDKQLVVEKMKALSTGDKIMVNDKGRAQYEQDFFGCFIMGSNNVRSFIRTDDDETRFWVRLIPRIEDADLDTELEQKLYKEIPAMLHLLNTRQMATEKLYRSWFHPALLNTVALQEVRAHSQPMVRKTINRYMRDMLMGSQQDSIMMTAEDINREVFKGRSDSTYITEVLTEMGVKRYTNETGQEVPKRYKYPRFVEEKTGDGTGNLINVLRFISAPVGRPFVFHFSRYYDEKEWTLYKTVDDDPTPPETSDAARRANTVADGKDPDDLPF